MKKISIEEVMAMFDINEMPRYWPEFDADMDFLAIQAKEAFSFELNNELFEVEVDDYVVATVEWDFLTPRVASIFHRYYTPEQFHNNFYLAPR